MTNARESVKLVHAALDEVGNDIVLRGVIDPASLSLLKVATYQREVLPLSKIRDLAEGLKKSTVPDIDLGMRGQTYLERDGAFYLQNDVYIIDGLQRRTAALELMKNGDIPRLGATVHFGTTESWERDRFRILNVARSKLSPNVLLRNLRSDIPFVEMLYQLTFDRQFVLSGRVCWEQRMLRNHLLTSLTLMKTVGRLHENFGAGLKDHGHEDLAKNMDKIMRKSGRSVIRDNIKTFWEIVDECWDVKNVQFKEGAVYLRGTFLLVLASLFANYQNFWRDTELFVEKPLRRKIAMFPISDPHVANLASASGPSRNILYQMMLDHVNSGKRLHRLTPFKKTRVKSEEAEPKSKPSQAAA